MKRKLCGLFALVFVIACAFSLCACGAEDANGTTGTTATTGVITPEGYTTYNDGYISFAYPANWGKTNGSVVVLKNPDGSGNNITVVYENKTDMYEKLTLSDFNTQLKPAYESMGMSISNASVEQEKVGGENVTVISYSAKVNGQSLKQRAYVVTSGARTYSITVTEFTSDAALAENVFNTIKVLK